MMTSPWSSFVWAGPLLAWLTLADASAETTTVKPNGSFLAARMTGDVAHKNATVKTAVGPIEHHTVTARSGDANLSITATVVPSIVAGLLSDGMLYRKARTELLGRYDGRVVNWSSCNHAGYGCRLLRYETRDGRKGLARFYFHDRVLVVLNAVYRESEKEADAFLASAG